MVFFLYGEIIFKMKWILRINLLSNANTTLCANNTLILKKVQ